MPWKTVPRNPPTQRSPPPFSTTAEFPPVQAALSVSDQRTLYLVNIFIVNTTNFLNRFSALCEEKLANVHGRILRLDASLTLLEVQLRSMDSFGETEEHCGRSDVTEPVNEPMLHNPSSLQSCCIPACRSHPPLSASVNLHQKSSMSLEHSAGPSTQPSI